MAAVIFAEACKLFTQFMQARVRVKVVCQLAVAQLAAVAEIIQFQIRRNVACMEAKLFLIFLIGDGTASGVEGDIALEAHN